MGRVEERARLGALLSEARAGEPVTVLVCGEAGVGKTRFLAEVTAAARDEAAISRLYGGIHFNAAIVNGITQGRCIGHHVSALSLRT